MKVILLENIPNLGSIGEVITVRAGYARNYLFPQKKAEHAEAGIVKQFAERRAALEANQKKMDDFFASLQQKMEGYTLSLIALASPDGNLYGSITAQTIANTLNEQKISEGVSFKRGQVILQEGPIKSIGDHSVKIKIKDNLVASITVTILTEKK